MPKFKITILLMTNTYIFSVYLFCFYNCFSFWCLIVQNAPSVLSSDASTCFYMVGHIQPTLSLIHGVYFLFFVTVNSL